MSHHKHGECCSSHGHDGHCSCCCHKECHEHHATDEHKDFAHQLIDLADQAWMEVLKDKVKAQIVSSSGPHLDQLAKLVSEANKSRWESKMALEKNAEEYRDKLADFFRHK